MLVVSSHICKPLLLKDNTMKKLIILSLLSTLGSSAALGSATPVEGIVKPVRATKKVYTRTKTYVVDAATEVGGQIKEVAVEVGQQLGEVGQEIYENQIKTPALWISEKASAAAVVLKDKISAAKSRSVRAVQDAKNSELVEDLKDVGQQLADVASAIGSVIKEKSLAIWDKAKVTAQAVQEELAN